MSSSVEGERCGECHGDDLDVVNIREIRRSSPQEEPSAREGPVVARRIDFRCRECGCDGFVLRRVHSGHHA